MAPLEFVARHLAFCHLRSTQTRKEGTKEKKRPCERKAIVISPVTREYLLAFYPSRESYYLIDTTGVVLRGRYVDEGPSLRTMLSLRKLEKGGRMPKWTWLGLGVGV